MMIVMKACVSPPWVDLGGGVKGQNSTFPEQGHVAYIKLKRIKNASTW